MPFKLCRSVLIFLALLVFNGGPAVAQEASIEGPFFTEDRLPADGRSSTILTVPRFGRYAILVESTQGTGLQLVDRMAGPGSIVGRAGEEDGRLDVFLDRGEYKVVTHGSSLATGEVQLSVHEFTERQPDPLQIVERKLISTQLEDFAQVSWWIHLKERRRVAFQAGGRHLRDLRLWQGGQWLIDARPTIRTVMPRTGQPLLVCELTTELNPGLYRLTAYGGVAQEWAEDSGERPLHIRYGFPELSLAERRRHIVGPLGTDTFLVPGPANYFRIEVPEARPVELGVRTHDASDPFSGTSSKARIEKESLPPVASVSTSSQATGWHRVTVTAEAGQPYVLQHFEAQDYYSFSHSGNYWISTVHTGHPSDSVDATAVLVEFPRGEKPSVKRSQVVEPVGDGWARRANLLAPLTVYLRVDKTGDYEVLAEGGAEANFRIEPFLIHRPPKYEPPKFRGTGSVWELDAGYHVMTVRPEKKGIVDLAIRPRGFIAAVRDTVGLENEKPEALPVDASIRFGVVDLMGGDTTYTLYVNRQPEVRTGLVIRPMPINFAQALPLTQKPEAVVEIPGSVDELSLLQAVAEDGTRLDLSVDGGPWSPEAQVEKGRYKVQVRWNGEGTVVYTLAARPLRLLAETPLPPVPEETLASLPDFQILTDHQKQFFDLKRRESRTFLVAAEEPALYQLGTSGLLATEGNLRTRVVTSLERQAQNGVGRNFLAQRYLREGDYQITVTTQGQSAGHLGLSLQQTEIQDGGRLSDGIPARSFLPAGEAVAYTFVVNEPGTYRLRSIGVGRTFRARLEDAEGWPIREPALKADITQSFEPGEYRLIVLPETLAARQLTLFERIRPRPSFEGHGPHELPLAQKIEHRWLEDVETEERPPDVFTFDLPAAADVDIVLTAEMQADLYRVSGGKKKAAYVPPARGFRGRLEAGRYEMEVTSFRINSGVDYELTVMPRPLVAGLARTVKAPSRTPVAIGAGQRLAQLTSFGSADVRASLLNAAGEIVAVSDDRPGDWNFSLTERLPSGDYVLVVDPVGASRAATQVVLKHPEEREGPVFQVGTGGAKTINVSQAVETRRLDLPADAEALVLTARSSETIGLSIEQQTSTGWQTVGSRVGRDVRLETYLGVSSTESEMAGAFRLRVWSLDQRGNPIELRAAAGPVRRVTEAELAAGLGLEKFGDTEVGVALLETESPGCFALAGEDAVRALSLRDTSQTEETRSASIASPVDGPVGGERLLLVADLDQRQRLRAERAVITGEPLRLRLPANARVTCDLAPTAADDGLRLAVVRGRAVVGAPGLAFGTSPDVLPAAAPPAVLTASLGGPAVTAWANGPAGGVEMRLEGWRLPLSEAQKVPWGTLSGQAEGSEVVAFELPAGEKRLRLTLGGSLAAVLADDNAVLSVHWSGKDHDGGNHEETLETNATRLFVAALDVDLPERFRVEVLPASEPRLLLNADRPLEARVTTAGLLRAAVKPGRSGLELSVRGSANALFVGVDGTIQLLNDAPLPVPADGGTLLAQHRPGIVLAWLSGNGADLWGAAPRATATARSLTLPSAVTLVNAVEAFEVTGNAPRVLHVRGTEALVTRLEIAGQDPRIEVYPEGVVFDAFLPPGAARLVVRGLAGRRPQGTLELRETPVTEIGEGLGPEVLLAAGEARFFGFTVGGEETGRVGLGVRADADAVDTVLLDESGNSIGRGVVQMHELAPGPYLLQLRLPPDAAPIKARPVVVGLERPSTEPPEDVVRRYLAMARR